MTTSSLPARPVLLVDDDTTWIQVMQKALGAMGWDQVRTLSDPTHAKALAMEFKPSLILLDLRLGNGYSGHDLLKDFTEALPDTPVIMLTGVDDADEAVACLRGGAADYLTKPVTRQSLERSIRRALGDLGHDREFETLEDALPNIRELPDLKSAPDMLIAEAIRRSGGILKDAAAMLGISPQAICNRRRRSSDQQP